ncbi:DUF1684 domain-containing protein [Jatrophihabitans sp. DSM 45814]
MTLDDAAQRYSFLVADWRRQVHALYAAVRAADTPVEAHAIWVTGRTELFNTHGASPLSAGQQLRHADYDPAFRFVLPVLDADPDRFEVPTGTDGVVPFERTGRFELPVSGAPGISPDISPDMSLDVWWLASYGGGVFLPIRDGSAGTLTYGAGRYLLDTVKGADLGRVQTADGQRWVIDLNFAYNPSCVYDPAWACPLAPAGNRIALAAPVGELLPSGY